LTFKKIELTLHKQQQAMKILVLVDYLPGSSVIVKNYRRKNELESGTVESVKAFFTKDGDYYLQYYIRLDRVTTTKSKYYPTGGCPLFLTVGSDRLYKPYKMPI